MGTGGEADRLMEFSQGSKALGFWRDFCSRMNITSDGVQLFDADEDLCVSVREVGKNTKRSLLTRSSEMEEMVVAGADKVVGDHDRRGNAFDGLIYMMFWLDDGGEVIPLYIGKTEKFGQGARNLSANITRLRGSKNKFARWGDGYQYHIGDFSAAVLAHAPSKITDKYSEWSDRLFVQVPAMPPEKPKLKRPTYFWMKPWSNAEIGPWEDFGATNLTFLEYLLIGVASTAYPETLLNKEGQNRG